MLTFTMCRFYNPKGEEISREDFIDIYSTIYYFLVDKRKEDNIDEMLKENHSLTEYDIITFLRWKVGDKKNNERKIITNYGTKIDIFSVKRLHSNISSNSFSDERASYEAILDNKVYNLGPVYILSLVYLYSKGEQPIYDKFSDIALTAITKDIAFRETVKYDDMPGKTSIDAVMKQYGDFKEKLNIVFKDSWKTNRDIDRALWTYGHMFN